MSTFVFWLVLVAGETKAGGLTLAGRVSSPSGGPVVGARVDISTAAPRVGRGLFCPSCYVDCGKWTRTDAAGRFQIADLNPALKFRVLVTAAQKQAELTELLDPLAGDITIVLKDMPADVPPQRTVRGQVVDDLGTPIEGALVSAAGAETAEERWWGQVDVSSTVTDTAGRFVTFLPDGYRSVDLEITADGYAGALFEQLRPGADEHKMVVLAGTAVTGRLVRDAQPMAGLRVAVVQIDRGASHHFIGPVDSVTDDEGRFDLEALPPGEDYAIFSVAADSRAEWVLTTKRFKAFGNRQTRDLGALDVIPALRLAGTVVPPDGQYLRPDCKVVLDRDPAWDSIVATVDDKGSFEMHGLPPEAYDIRVAADGFALDPERMPYQLLAPDSFGFRLRETVGDLRIFLKPAAPSDPRSTRE